ncbi:hypothetical protein H9P43_005824 [Blastocladiella emersonii ATCC 22665]|nr:hypothetical protein H9P43_005824 [Blastocladiella emersonii ATCC 22665]
MSSPSGIASLPSPIDGSPSSSSPSAAAPSIYHDGITEFTTTVADVTTRDMLGIMGASIAFSTAIFVWAVTRWLRLRSNFNLAVVLLTLFFIMGDVYYFAALAGDVLHPYLFEVIRGSTSLMAATHVSGLSLYRFAIFQETTFARWYTNRLRTSLLAVNYLLALACSVFLLFTYFSPTTEPHNDARRPLALSAILVWTVLVDVSIMVLTFICVLQVQKQIGSSYSEHRASIVQVLITLVLMVLGGGTGILIFIQDGGYWGGSLGGVFARFYVLGAMFVWYQIVAIVRGTNSQAAALRRSASSAVRRSPSASARKSAGSNASQGGSRVAAKPATAQAASRFG